MNKKLSLIATLFLLFCCNFVYADPPARVARLSFIAGNVGFATGNTDNWVQATLNRPLVSGDSLWCDVNSKAELELGAAEIRIGNSTQVNIAALDDNTAQLQLGQGQLFLHIDALAPNQTYEVDTPNLAFVAGDPGDYIIYADPQGTFTTISVLTGSGQVYGANNTSYPLSTAEFYSFSGTDLSNRQVNTLPQEDAFTQWNDERDNAISSAQAGNYVAPDTIGYEDLDNNGTWNNDAEYGSVWVPANVPTGWAPYSNGYWSWIPPYGWTWIDNSPWGFVTSHYGRWAAINGQWAWIPGPNALAPVYAPALVAFLGGSLGLFSGGYVGWFPLGPNDPYIPPYAVSAGYFNNINNANFKFHDNKQLGQYYNNHNAKINYHNRGVSGSITAVSDGTFASGKPIARNKIKLPQNATSASVSTQPNVTPTNLSTTGSATQTTIKPPANLLKRHVVNVHKIQPNMQLPAAPKKQQYHHLAEPLPLEMQQQMILPQQPKHVKHKQMVLPQTQQPLPQQQQQVIQQQMVLPQTPQPLPKKPKHVIHQQTVLPQTQPPVVHHQPSNPVLQQPIHHEEAPPHNQPQAPHVQHPPGSTLQQQE